MKRYLTFFFLLITSIALCAYPEGAINNIDGSALGWDEANQVWRPIAVDATGNLQSGGTVIDNISVDTSSIDSALNVDDKSVAELVNGIGTDTSNIESYLKTNVGSPGSPDIKNISELIASVFKAYDSNYNGGLTVQYLLSTINSTVNAIAYVLGGNIGTDVGAIKTETASLTKQPNELRMQRISNIAANVATNVGYIVDVNSPAVERIFVELRAIDETAVFYIGLSNAVTDSTGRPVKGRILLNIPKTQSLYIYHTNASAIDIQQTEGWR